MSGSLFYSVQYPICTTNKSLIGRFSIGKSPSSTPPSSIRKPISGQGECQFVSRRTKEYPPLLDYLLRLEDAQEYLTSVYCRRLLKPATPPLKQLWFSRRRTAHISKYNTYPFIYKRSSTIRFVFTILHIYFERNLHDDTSDYEESHFLQARLFPCFLSSFNFYLLPFSKENFLLSSFGWRSSFVSVQSLSAQTVGSQSVSQSCVFSECIVCVMPC